MDNNQNIETEKVHKRRVRYKGTHPEKRMQKSIKNNSLKNMLIQ